MAGTDEKAERDSSLLHPAVARDTRKEVSVVEAIYARQSIDKRDSLSIEGQIEQCQKDAGDNVQVYQDKGFSGKNTKRPAFMELLRAVEAGEIRKVIVYRLDRISRSIADFSRLWELFDEHGVEFQSVTEKFDTSSPIGRAMLNIVLVFAQLERETTAERVRDNYLHRFTLGAWPGGPAPYGFELTKILDGGKKISSLVANEKAETVERLFREYAKPGASLRSIARELTEEGIPGPKRETWDSVTLSRILHSPLYVCADEAVYWYYIAQGIQARQGIEAFTGNHACNVIGRRDRGRNRCGSHCGQMLTVANHRGFISSDLWLEVQDKLAGNRQIPKENAGRYSWLTGLMKCAKCGYAVKIIHARAEDRFYLACSGRANFADCDSVIHLDLRELEEQVAFRIDEILSNCPPEKICPDLPESTRMILETERKIACLVEAISRGGDISTDYIIREIEMLHREREQLLERCRAPATQPERVEFKKANFEEKKLIAGAFIDKILLQDDSAEILWKI